MCIKFILQAKKWLIPIVGIYIAGESCHACTARRSPTPPIPKDDIHPGELHASIDHSDAEDSTSSEDNASSASSTSSEDSASSVSSGFASGSASSVSSGFASGSASSVSSGFSSGSASSVSSGFSSGSASSVSSSPTDFAGLPNVGNSCYMNAVLQVIAALYEDEVQNGSLKDLIHKINTSHQPLNDNDIKDCIGGLPENAKKMAEPGQQGDPDEFITRIMEPCLYAENPNELIYPITCTKHIFFKIKSQNQKEQEKIWAYNIPSNGKKYMLAIPVMANCDLNKMIKAYQEKKVKEEGAIDIDWNKARHCENQDLPPFVKQHQDNIAPIEHNASKGVPKDYIQQIVLELPDKLYLKLDRNTTGSKIDSSISGTMELSIAPNPNEQHTDSFALNGCIVHRGGGTTSGHYIAYVKRAEQWYEANDRDITKIDVGAAEAASRDAYLFFYKKI